MDAAMVVTETPTIQCIFSVSVEKARAQKDDQITVEAEALATEALRLANDAREIAKRLEEIKAKLALMNEASHSLSKSPLFETEDITDEATPFETDKAFVIARITNSWTVSKDVHNIPTAFEPEARDTDEIVSHCTSHDSRASALVVDNDDVTPGGMPSKESHYRDDFPESVRYDDPFLADLPRQDGLVGKRAAIMGVDAVTGTIGVQADKLMEANEYGEKARQLKREVEIAKVVLPPTGDEKGSFESVLDAMGLDIACGIDKASFALYDEESIAAVVKVGPNRLSAGQHRPRISQLQRNDASFIDVFGDANDDDFVAACSRIADVCEPALADLDEPQVYYTSPIDEADEVQTGLLSLQMSTVGSASIQRKSILKSPSKLRIREPSIEIKQIQQLQGVVEVEIDPEEEEIEKKSVCFQGAEPDGAKAEVDKKQSKFEISDSMVEKSKTLAASKEIPQPEKEKGKDEPVVDFDVHGDEVELLDMVDSHIWCI